MKLRVMGWRSSGGNKLRKSVFDLQFDDIDELQPWHRIPVAMLQAAEPDVVGVHTIDKVGTLTDTYVWLHEPYVRKLMKEYGHDVRK